MKYLFSHGIKEILLYFRYKLNRPIIFWPIRFGIDWLVIILANFYKGKLNRSWRTYILDAEGNFTSKGREAEENNLIICIIKYCKPLTIKRILSKEDLEIKYIDTNLRPLHFAYINRNKKMIDILIKYGANEELKTLKGYKAKQL